MTVTLPNSAAERRDGRLPDAVVVVGATGFIGRNLVERLASCIGRVIPVSTSGAAVCGVPGMRIAELAGAELPADAVLVNAAAYRYDASRFADAQAEILLRNVELYDRVYEICVHKGIHEVRNLSSIAIYPADDAALDDGASLDLNRPPHQGEQMYAWSKRVGEIYAGLFARQYGINTVSFRLTNPYGPHDSTNEEKAHVVPAFVIRALTTSGPFTLRGNPQASRDFIYVDDVCEVVVRSQTWRGVTAFYNLGSGESTTIETLARTVLRLAGHEREIVTEGAATSGVVHRSCDNARLLADFEIDRLTPLELGLTLTIDWYRDVCRRRT